jgi:hypothetical protein
MAEMGVSPLILNLLLPFKDNKRKLDLLYQDFEVYIDELVQAGEEVKESTLSSLGGNVPVTVAARGGRYGRKYFWRFRAKGANRKMARLSDSLFEDAIRSLHYEQRVGLLAAERELLAINANLEMLGVMKSVVDQYRSELDSAYMIQMAIDPSQGTLPK